MGVKAVGLSPRNRRTGFIQREARFARKIVTAIEAIRRAFLERLTHLGLHESDAEPTRQYPGVDEAIDETFTVEELAHAIMDATGAEYRLAYAEAATVLDVQTGFTVAADIPRAALQKFADQFAQSVIDDERTQLLALIDNALETGAGPVTLRKAIVSFFDAGIHRVSKDGTRVAVVNLTDWANMVAVTELSRAYNYGALDLYTEAGYEELQWVAAEDDLMCDICGDLDGQVVKIGDEFDEGITQPPAHPSCRCTIMADPDARNDLDPAARARAAHGNAGEYASDVLQESAGGFKIDGIRFEGPAKCIAPFQMEIARLGDLPAFQAAKLWGVSAFPYPTEDGGVHVAATTSDDDHERGQLVTFNTKIDPATYHADGAKLTDVGGFAAAPTTVLALARFDVAWTRQFICDHELGHVWQNDFNAREAKTWAAAVNAATIPEIAAVSSYATCNPHECFAEMFATYVNGAGESLPPACRAWFDARIEPQFVRKTPRDPRHSDSPVRRV